MEAKDTTLRPDELIRLNDFTATNTDIEASFAKQAEISFKMGYNQALKDIKDGLSPSVMV